MIQIILIWLYATILFFSIGYAIVAFIKKLNIYSSNNFLSIEYILFAGIAAITTIISYISIVLPTGYITHLILILFSTIIIIFLRKDILIYLVNLKLEHKSIPYYFWLLLIPIFIYVLLKSASPSEIYDDNLYYLQTIHWIEKYPAIPGLANLHGRLGFNSSWHLLSAVFSFSFLGCHYFNDLNGYLFLLVAITSIRRLKNIYQKGFNLYDFIQVSIILFILYYMKDYFTAPTADFPIAVFCWVVLNTCLKNIDAKYNNQPINYIELSIVMLLSIFSLTIKISIAPICLILLYLIIIFIQKKLYKTIIILSTLCILIITPYITRNIIQTGYAVFPIIILPKIQTTS